MILSWEEYFMELAKISALRSKDPNTQVGACVVGTDNKILGIGYNGFPRGCSDEDFPWVKPDKYLYVCHAEINCLLNANNLQLLSGSILYSTLFPCNECAKVIIQLGIKEIVYLSDKYMGTEGNIAAKRMFQATGIAYRQFANKQFNTPTYQNTLMLDNYFC